ncbi:MAG: hypothetical protein ACRDYB_07850 [Acidimicrobiales bacterium]
MVGTSLSPIALPKSEELTNALIAPGPTLVDRSEFDQLRADLEARLAAASATLPGDRPLRVDGYRLGHPDPLEDEAKPFEWGLRTARRPLGLDCARQCVADRRVHPVDAAQAVVAGLIGRAAQGAERPGSLGEWLAALTNGARGVVQAEAVGWASKLVTTLDWARLPRPIIGADRSVVFPAAPQVLLRGRIEVRVSTASRSQAPTGTGRTECLFLMMTGRPSPSSDVELGLPALTVACDPRRPAVPVRVIGWWPECGRAQVVPVDLRLLERTVERVVETVTIAATQRRNDPIAA